MISCSPPVPPSVTLGAMKAELIALPLLNFWFSAWMRLMETRFWHLLQSKPDISRCQDPNAGFPGSPLWVGVSISSPNEDRHGRWVCVTTHKWNRTLTLWWWPRALGWMGEHSKSMLLHSHSQLWSSSNMTWITSRLSREYIINKSCHTLAARLYHLVTQSFLYTTKDVMLESDTELPMVGRFQARHSWSSVRLASTIWLPYSVWSLRSQGHLSRQNDWWASANESFCSKYNACS